MPQLARSGAVLNYETWGEGGPWVTLVNGHVRPLTDFRMLGRHLTSLGFRVLALDNRGAGLTTTTTAFTLADMAADVSSLWDHLGIATSALLGISMGGFIAQTIAGDEVTATRVSQLFLVSTAMRQALISPDRRPWTTDPAEVELKLRTYFTAQFFERNRPLVRGMAKQVAKAVAEGPFVEQSKRQVAAIRGVDLTVTASHIKAPTYVLHGAEDEVIALSAGEELQAHIHGANLQVFPGAGHLLLAEAPQALYNAVAKALA